MQLTRDDWIEAAIAQIVMPFLASDLVRILLLLVPGISLWLVHHYS